MNKEERDAYNLACLAAYMISQGITTPDKLPF